MYRLQGYGASVWQYCSEREAEALFIAQQKQGSMAVVIVLSGTQH